MQISNNIAAYDVWKNYTNNVSALRNSMSKLSSGSRIGNAGDDASGLAMSERMRSQIRNTEAAANNVENKLNYLQTTDSWLQRIQDMLGRMGELAVMANDGTKSDTDKAILQKEFAQMQDEIARITTGNEADGSDAAGKFSGTALFQGGDDIVQQVGADGGQIFTSSAIDLRSTATDALSYTYEDSGGNKLLLNDDGTTYSYADGWDAGADYSGTAPSNFYTDDTMTTEVFWTGTEWNTVADGSGTTHAGTAYAEDLEGNELAATDDSTSTYADAMASGTTFSASGTVTSNATSWGDLINSDLGAATPNPAISIASQSGAQSAVGIIQLGIDHVSDKRADIGAQINRLDQTLQGLRSYQENISAAESRIRDVDVAKETAEMTKYQILQQVGTAMLSQANQLPNQVMKLLG